MRRRLWQFTVLPAAVNSIAASNHSSSMAKGSGSDFTAKPSGQLEAYVGRGVFEVVEACVAAPLFGVEVCAENVVDGR